MVSDHAMGTKERYGAFRVMIAPSFDQIRECMLDIEKEIQDIQQELGVELEDIVTMVTPATESQLLWRLQERKWRADRQRIVQAREEIHGRRCKQSQSVRERPAGSCR